MLGMFLISLCPRLSDPSATASVAVLIVLLLNSLTHPDSNGALSDGALSDYDLTRPSSSNTHPDHADSDRPAHSLTGHSP